MNDAERLHGLRSVHIRIEARRFCRWRAALNCNAGVCAQRFHKGAGIRVLFQIISHLRVGTTTPNFALMMFSAVICGLLMPTWQLSHRSTRCCCVADLLDERNCVTVTCLTSVGAERAGLLDIFTGRQ